MNMELHSIYCSYIIAVLKCAIKSSIFPKGTCAPSDEEEEECRDIVETLEKIDTILDEHGIVFVKTAIGQLEKAKENWIRY